MYDYHDEIFNKSIPYGNNIVGLIQAYKEKICSTRQGDQNDSIFEFKLESYLFAYALFLNTHICKDLCENTELFSRFKEESSEITDSIKNVLEVSYIYSDLSSNFKMVLIESKCIGFAYGYYQADIGLSASLEELNLVRKYLKKVWDIYEVRYIIRS